MSNESAPKYDLSGGPSAEFGNDGSKMGHRDYTEWRKAGGSHDEFMQYMYDNPGMQAKGSNLVAELEKHGQNRDFREGDRNPENTDFGWLGWDNVNSNVGYDLLPGEKPEEPEPEMKPITYSQKVQDAKERVSNYEDKYINYAAEDHPFYAASKAKNKTATTTNSEDEKTSIYNKEEEDKQQAASTYLNLSNSSIDLRR